MNCPKCGEYSAVQSMRTIVSGGISNTSGSAISYPILGEGALTATYFGSTTSSVLADRLMPPGMPTARVWPWIVSFTTLFVLIAPKAAYDAVFPSSGYFTDSVSFIFSSIFLVFGIMIGLILGILFAIIMRAIGNATWMKPIQEDWYPRSARVWNTYYCGRDDTMFDEWYAASPEDFISHVWFSPLSEGNQELSSNSIDVDSTLVDSLKHNALRFRRNSSAREVNIAGFIPLSRSLGNSTIAEARMVIKGNPQMPSVSGAIQASRQAHLNAEVSPEGELSTFGDPSLAGMPFYGAVFPVGAGGYSEKRAIAASTALTQELWDILDDTLANGVSARSLEVGLELLLTVEVVSSSYAGILSQLSVAIPEMRNAAELNKSSFLDAWEKEAGLTLHSMTEIIHSHRDTLLSADFYRESQKNNDSTAEIWGLLSKILQDLG